MAWTGPRPVGDGRHRRDTTPRSRHSVAIRSRSELWSTAVVGVQPFTPRELLENPTQFGRFHSPVWKHVPDDHVSKARAALALQQHHLALAMDEEMRERGCTQRELAEELGMTAGTFGKRLRGHDPLSATEVYSWLFFLRRVELWPVPENLDDLLP